MEYTCEKLSERYQVCISKNHRFGTDAFLLAAFSAPRHIDKVCDLCSGCGIIPLILMRDYSPASVTGIEIQDEAAALFALSVAKSGADNIYPIHADIKSAGSRLARESYDVITCNPPYKRSNTGILNNKDAQSIARHEILCDIYDVCRTAAQLLKFGGRLCICQRPERLSDVIDAMKKCKIEPKRLKLVSKDPASPPWLILIEGKKGSKPFMQIEPPLFVNNDINFNALRMDKDNDE